MTLSTTANVNAVLKLSKERAAQLEQEYADVEHFLWALYNASIDTPQSVTWLETQGVNSEKMRQLLSSDSISTPLKRTTCMDFSPKFKKILAMAEAISPSEPLTTEIIIGSVLMHGKSHGTELLETCSDGQVKAFELPVPKMASPKATAVPAAIVRPLDPKILPRYGGLATFARLPTIEQVSTFDIAVLGMPYDSGCTYRPGARFGPGAIRQASRILRGYHPVLDVNTFFDQQVVDAGDVCCNPFNVAETISSVIDRADELLSQNGRLMTIGGDHSISYPLLKAYHRHYGPITLVHFDAHLDTWDTYFGEAHTHGTPFRRAAEENLFCPNTSMHVGIRGPVYDAEDFVQDAEMGFKIVRADEIEDLGIKGVIEKIRQRVGTSTPIYISIDIDVLDPAFAPGTGTPEAGGFSSRELLNLLRGFRGLSVVGADVVEVAPAYDHAEITSMAASTLCFELMSLMAVSQKNYNF